MHGTTTDARNPRHAGLWHVGSIFQQPAAPHASRPAAEPLYNTQAAAELVVEQRDLGSDLGFGSGVFPAVFATSRMIALMEAASAAMLAPHLREGECSVGVSMHVTHGAATPLASTVTASARYLGREGKLYLSEVVARDEGGEIGRGLHQRAIVGTDRPVAGALKRTGPHGG